MEFIPARSSIIASTSIFGLMAKAKPMAMISGSAMKKAGRSAIKSPRYTHISPSMDAAPMLRKITIAERPAPRC